MTTTAQKVEVVGTTLTGSAVGFFVAGPVGLGVGLTLGALADFLILRAKAGPIVVPASANLPAIAAVVAATVTPPVVPSSPSLPPGVDMDAANRVGTLIVLSVGAAHPMPVDLVQFDLKKFQTSVGLPATGILDAASRAMLALASPSTAAHIPAVNLVSS